MFPRLYNNDMVCNLNIDPCKCRAYASSIFTSSIIQSEGCIRDEEYDGIHRAYQARGYTIHKFQTRDKNYQTIDYRLELNVVDTNTDVCHNDTFLFVMILVHQRDIDRRMLFRENIKREIIDGKRVDYGFFVVADKGDTEAIQSITTENRAFHDVLYSQHKDSYTNVTLTMLDSFLWIRDHCPARFIIRLDADCFLHVPNAVKYLSSVNEHFFYGGYHWRATLYSKKDKKTAFDVPADYPRWKRVFNYVLGGGYIVSADIVPFINIGTLYQDLVIHAAEDCLLGRLLENVDIHPSPTSWKYNVFMDLTLHKRLRNLSKWPKNVIIVHNLKNFTFQQQVFAHFKSALSSVCNKKKTELSSTFALISKRLHIKRNEPVLPPHL